MDMSRLLDCAPLTLAESSAWGEGSTLVALLPKDSLLEAARILKEQKFYLEFMTALDVREGFFLTYLFSTWREMRRIVLRVRLERESPEAPSLVFIHSGADWHERECRDFFGIVFTGHPHPEPLLLPAEMTEHPLRKHETARKSVSVLLPLDQITPSSAKILARVCENAGFDSKTGRKAPRNP